MEATVKLPQTIVTLIRDYENTVHKLSRLQQAAKLLTSDSDGPVVTHMTTATIEARKDMYKVRSLLETAIERALEGKS
jgi:hypothetical protein